MNLTEYRDEIQAIAKANNVTYKKAVDLMIQNLAVMKEHHKGSGAVNFHTLGQKWNKLSYKEKIAQRTQALNSQPTRTWR